MKFSKLLILLALAISSSGFSQELRQFGIIPYPEHETPQKGTYKLPAEISYTTNYTAEDLKDLQQYLPNYPLKLKAQQGKAVLEINLTGTPQDIQKGREAASNGEYLPLEDEGYTLSIARKHIKIESPTTRGAFYALQTLAKLAEDGKGIVPITTITDKPRFKYRGLHLDVSRHFFDIDFLKKQIDLLCTYKINRIHWHLTDTHGWRLEIPAYPKLTELSAWRTASDINEWAEKKSTFCTKDDSQAYGGYYTADDVKELVEYARLRHVTIIPEIEIPGHSWEVVSAYPELSCDDEPGYRNEVCIGNEKTFRFFETVLDEVTRLFPSHYIHIGGDEASRMHWKKCSLCQARIKEENLNGEDELQSYIIKRMEKYLNSKGRNIIGWDEILDGGLAPNATVMSWRGTDGGVKAARMKHNVIMTPTAHCYLDMYPDIPETQPKAFAYVVSLDNVYAYDPAPKEFGEEFGKYILGVQGNTWTEWIASGSHAEYMIYPRIIAISEVGWSQMNRRDAENFKERITREIKRVLHKGYNAFPLSPYVKSKQQIDRENKCIELSLSAERSDVQIHYTMDSEDTTPTINSPIYSEPFIVKDSVKVYAQLFENGTPIGTPLYIRADYHKAIGKSITYNEKCDYYHKDKRYTGGGDTALIDGIRGSISYADGKWQGFYPNNMDVTIDLGEVTGVHYIKANFAQCKNVGANLPEKVEIYGSVDGKRYMLIATDEPTEEEKLKETTFKEMGWTGDRMRIRYIRYQAIQAKPQYMFCDEIVIQ